MANKISILGLVIIGASGIVAAILPNKSAAEVEDADNGTIMWELDNVHLTCIPDIDDSIYSCNVSIEDDTATTEDPFDNSYVDFDENEYFTDQTIDNTSLTNDGIGSSFLQ